MLLARPADDEYRVHSILEVGDFAVNAVFSKLVTMITPKNNNSIVLLLVLFQSDQDTSDVVIQERHSTVIVPP